MDVKDAVGASLGGGAGATVTACVVLPCAPLLSVTVSVTVYVPSRGVGVAPRSRPCRRPVTEVPGVARDGAVGVGRARAVDASRSRLVTPSR